MFSDILTAKVISRLSEEDLCSQLNYLWSAFFIALMGVGVSLVQYVGEPIRCWCPAQLPQVQCNYTLALCWVKQNYYVHEDKAIPFKEEDRDNITVAYYPWVPWILFSMAAMLNLPHIIWVSFVSSSGLNLGKFIGLADSHEDLANLATILRIWLVRTHRVEKNMVGSVKQFLGSIGLFWFGKHHRTYLCGLSLLVKLSYLVVSVGLFISLNLFIDEHFVAYGYEVVERFLRGIPYDSARFPKQTLCDFRIRQMNNIHTYTIQCLLPINLYNEKIFIFLWFWYIILISFNSYSFLKWAYNLLSPSRRTEFVRKYVMILFYIIDQKKIKDRDKRDEALLAEETNNNEPEAVPLVIQPATATRPMPRERRTDRLRRTMRSTFLGISERPSGHNGVSIETTEEELRQKERKRKINRITNKMIKHFGHDGVVVFRTLEESVGIVIANQIFQELYEQFNTNLHYK